LELVNDLVKDSGFKVFLELLQLEVLSVLPIPGGNEVIPTCGLNRVVTCSKKPVKLVPKVCLSVYGMTVKLIHRRD